MKTNAVKQGDSWVINGTKHYITNAMIADAHVLFARTDPGDGSAAFTGFIVDNDNPGIKMSKVEDKMGASPTTEYFIEDCKVPDSAVLGQVHKGMPLALSALEIARIGIGTQGLGLMQVLGRIEIKETAGFRVQSLDLGLRKDQRTANLQETGEAAVGLEEIF